MWRIEKGRKMIEEMYRVGLNFTIIDSKEIRDDDLVVIVSVIGGGVQKEIAEKVAELTKILERPCS